MRGCTNLKAGVEGAWMVKNHVAQLPRWRNLSFESRFLLKMILLTSFISLILLILLAGFLVGKEDTLAEASNILSACLFP